MKNLLQNFLVLSLLIFLPLVANCQKNDKSKIIKPVHKNSYAAGCVPPSAYMYLDINNVKARINTGGDMWWDLFGNAMYEVPKGSGKNSLFSGSIWIGGFDVNGQLKLAANQYRQYGNDYWSGPLTTDGAASIDIDECFKYDRVFSVTKNEVRMHIAWHQNPSAFPNYTIPVSILEWPAHGDISKEQSYYLAPFYSPNGNIKYKPEDGDYPYYDFDNKLCHSQTTTAEGNGFLSDQILKGDQTLWWVFNDNGNSHTESQGKTIGLEIRAQAYAYATNDELNNMTFYNYEIINRSSYTLLETYFAKYIDPDLGYNSDDYVGCDVSRGLGYCYNGKAIDGYGAPNHYGEQPPAVGIKFFLGPYLDPDGIDDPKFDAMGHLICGVGINGSNFGDGIIDNERYGMTKFVNKKSFSIFPQPGEITLPIHYYNLMRAIWPNNEHILYGSSGHLNNGAYGPACDFMFPGDTDPCNWGTGGIPPNGSVFWTEETTGNLPGDRRFLQTTGPFTLEPGAVNYLTIGVVWARASTGGPLASVELLKLASDKAQQLFDNCFDIIEAPHAPVLNIRELDRELILYITNPIFSNNYLEHYKKWDYTIKVPPNINLNVPLDSFYHFEGYQIFQLKDNTVTASDVNNPDKARLVAQCDIENYTPTGEPIGQLINWYYSSLHNGNIPVEEVNGENKGIKHSFKIIYDEFATGDRRLINHKKYHYMAIAYAYNSYMPYSQDPAVIYGLYGQKTPFLSSNKSAIGGAIQSVTGIPHITSPDGKVLNTSYADGPKITRIEGQGNGGNWLELTDESIQDIMAGPPWKVIHPTYKNKYGPIEIKVIDPFKVAKGNYLLKFNVLHDSLIGIATWTLINKETLMAYNSDTSIVIANEQLLVDLGISITIKQVKSPGYNREENNGLILSSISYTDSTKRWLGGVQNIDGYGSFNWIRAGTLVDSDNPQNNDYDYTGVSSGAGLDDGEAYEKIINGTWAPYRLSSRYMAGPQNPDNLSVALNKIDNIASVDIVLTSDKNKWSRCPVLEMGLNSSLNEGHAKRFELRRGASVNKNGLPDGTGTGMGWFPGYAINLETGERLNIMFGEDSKLTEHNGRDMIFNPTPTLLTEQGYIYYTHGMYQEALSELVFGGKHYVYIMGSNKFNAYFPQEIVPSYDEGLWIYNKLYAPPEQSPSLQNQRVVYRDIIYVGIPLSIHSEEWLNNEVRIRIRVAKPYAQNYSTYGEANPLNNNFPMYAFSLDELAPEFNNIVLAKDALELINVVPNPYYAYSAYERNQLDNRIKVINLPKKCTVSIYTLNGTLVRQYTKDENKTSIDWDLKNHAGIPIAGGVYLIHVYAHGIGERVIKWFGVLRPQDLYSY